MEKEWIFQIKDAWTAGYPYKKIPYLTLNIKINLQVEYRSKYRRSKRMNLQIKDSTGKYLYDHRWKKTSLIDTKDTNYNRKNKFDSIKVRNFSSSNDTINTVKKAAQVEGKISVIDRPNKDVHLAYIHIKPLRKIKQIEKNAESFKQVLYTHTHKKSKWPKT